MYVVFCWISNTAFLSSLCNYSTYIFFLSSFLLFVSFHSSFACILARSQGHFHMPNVGSLALAFVLKWNWQSSFEHKKCRSLLLTWIHAVVNSKKIIWIWKLSILSNAIRWVIYSVLSGTSSSPNQPWEISRTSLALMLPSTQSQHSLPSLSTTLSPPSEQHCWICLWLRLKLLLLPPPKSPSLMFLYL